VGQISWLFRTFTLAQLPLTLCRNSSHVELTKPFYARRGALIYATDESTTGKLEPGTCLTRQGRCGRESTGLSLVDYHCCTWVLADRMNHVVYQC
jgi:hypothetical protein